MMHDYWQPRENETQDQWLERTNPNRLFRVRDLAIAAALGLTASMVWQWFV